MPLHCAVTRPIFFWMFIFFSFSNPVACLGDILENQFLAYICEILWLGIHMYKSDSTCLYLFPVYQGAQGMTEFALAIVFECACGPLFTVSYCPSIKCHNNSANKQCKNSILHSKLFSHMLLTHRSSILSLNCTQQQWRRPSMIAIRIVVCAKDIPPRSSSKMNICRMVHIFQFLNAPGVLSRNTSVATALHHAKTTERRMTSDTSRFILRKPNQRNNFFGITTN